MDSDSDPWSHKYPSDPEVVMHLLTTYISLNLESISSEKVFFQDYSNYIRPPSMQKSEDLTIIQVSNKSFAPHYEIQQGGVQH
jgi:hypothetical protein